MRIAARVRPWGIGEKRAKDSLRLVEVARIAVAFDPIPQRADLGQQSAVETGDVLSHQSKNRTTTGNDIGATLEACGWARSGERGRIPEVLNVASTRLRPPELGPRGLFNVDHVVVSW